MVPDPRTAPGIDRLRPLNEPKPAGVQADVAGRPLAVLDGRQRLGVASVLDHWRIDDEWWREKPVSRAYWRLALADGRTLTLYQDLATGHWWAQGY